MIAAFRLGVPSTAVYLVKPALIALIAASLMCCGVSKSGSPAPRPMMSRPLALSAAARAVTARVGEGLMACTRRESSTMVPSEHPLERKCYYRYVLAARFYPECFINSRDDRAGFCFVGEFCEGAA